MLVTARREVALPCREGLADVGGVPDHDTQQEAAYLRGVHTQNELARDTFLGVGSTTAFAASIAFIADVVQLADAAWRPLLWLAWLMFVISIVALVISFETSRRRIEHDLAHLYDETPPPHRLSAIANAIPPWSFCAGILLLFAFITINMEGSQMSRPTTPSDFSPPKPGGGVNPAPRPPAKPPGK